MSGELMKIGSIPLRMSHSEQEFINFAKIFPNKIKRWNGYRTPGMRCKNGGPGGS